MLLPAGGVVHNFRAQWPKELKAVCRMNFVLPMLLPTCLAAGVDIVLPGMATPHMFVALFFAHHLETPIEMLAFFRKLGVPLQGMCDGRAQDGHWPPGPLRAPWCS